MSPQSPLPRDPLVVAFGRTLPSGAEADGFRVLRAGDPEYETEYRRALATFLATGVRPFYATAGMLAAAAERR